MMIVGHMAMSTIHSALALALAFTLSGGEPAIAPPKGRVFDQHEFI